VIRLLLADWWAVLFLLPIAIAVLASDTATASSASPFNFEYSARFSDVYLMRVRDTAEGVVCYVARDQTTPVGVSCVRERELAPVPAAP
jgi:hypothetical protein